MRELGGKALTQNQTLDAAAAHPRLSILVNGRISTSLSRPDMSWPHQLVRLLPPKLQAGREIRHVSMGADRKANTWERRRTPTRSQRFP